MSDRFFVPMVWALPAVWIYFRATSKRIGWVRGASHRPNLPAFVWAAITFVFPPVGLYVYFTHEPELVEVAKAHPAGDTFVPITRIFLMMLPCLLPFCVHETPMSCSDRRLARSAASYVRTFLHAEHVEVRDVHALPLPKRLPWEAIHARCSATLIVDMRTKRVDFEIADLHARDLHARVWKIVDAESGRVHFDASRGRRTRR